MNAKKVHKWKTKRAFAELGGTDLAQGYATYRSSLYASQMHTRGDLGY